MQIGTNGLRARAWAVDVGAEEFKSQGRIRHWSLSSFTFTQRAPQNLYSVNIISFNLI